MARKTGNLRHNRGLASFQVQVNIKKMLFCWVGLQENEGVISATSLSSCPFPLDSCGALAWHSSENLQGVFSNSQNFKIPNHHFYEQEHNSIGG